jgi:outer membrane immunogenic protein
MKARFVATLAGAALLSGAAAAADLPMPAPMSEYKAPAVVAPVYNWTGCYISGGFGYGVWNQDYVNETIPGLVPQTARATNGGRGWMGLAGGGCDVQIPIGGIVGNVVVGAFGDYDFMNVHGVTALSTFPISVQGDQKQSSAWAVGGRVGVLVTPNLLGYTNGGFTQSHFNQDNLQVFGLGPVVALTPSHTFNGWFLGGGTEYALNFSWLPIHGLFWRNEYRYSTFNKADLPLLFASGAPTGLGYNVKYYEQAVLSQLIWRFNWQ